MLKKVNGLLEKMMPLITPVSVILGVVFAESLVSLSMVVPWIFAFMTFSGSLSLDFKALQRAVSHPLSILLALTVLHVVMPLWAWSVGMIVFHGELLTITGLVLAFVIPTGITSFIWVSIYKGNIALTLSIILIDTLLAPFLVPAILSLFVGQQVEMDGWSMMRGLLGMIVVPSFFGMVLNEWTKGRAKELLGPRFAPFSKLSLGLVVMINGAIVAPYLRNVDGKLLSIAITVFFLACSGYLISWFVGVLLKREKEEVISLIFTGGMRNITAGAVIAVAYFPSIVAVPVVIGMLFQQVLASVYGQLVKRFIQRQKIDSSA